MSHGIVDTWDEANGVIELATSLGSFSAEDLYEEWKEEMTTSATLSGSPPAFRTIGGEPIGGGVEVGSIPVTAHHGRRTHQELTTLPF